MSKKEEVHDDPPKSSSFGRVIKQKRIEDLGAEEEPPSKKKSKNPPSPCKDKWTGEDDGKLIEAMQTLGDYEKILRLVSFSFKPTAKDIQERWNQLLYSQKEPSDTDKRAPWTEEEEAILLREGGSETFSGFHVILEQFASNFYPSRTPRDLEAHYFRLKRTKSHPSSQSSPSQQHNSNVNGGQSAASNSPSKQPLVNASAINLLLPTAVPGTNASTDLAQDSDETDSNSTSAGALDACLYLEPDLAEPSPVLDEVEAKLNLSPLSGSEDQPPAECMSPMQHANRNREYGRIEKLAQREILKVEKEYARDRDSLRERDTKMLATVRGKRLRFSMRTKEAIIGRGSALEPVDINVTEEGSTNLNKCSRKHAIIKMKRDGEFYIKNIGKHLLYVNDHGVSTGKKKLLCDNCLIRISDIYFIFEINKISQNKIKRQLQM